MQNIKIEEWEKFGICYLRMSPVMVDADGNPITINDEPKLDPEGSFMVCALPQMRKSRVQGIFSSIWEKIRRGFHHLEEVVDTGKMTFKLLRGIKNSSKMIVPRKQSSRVDGKGGVAKFRTVIQPEEFSFKPEAVRGSIGFDDEGNSIKFDALHEKYLKETLEAAVTLGIFKGETGTQDFSEGRSMLKTLIGKYVIWDLCDQNGVTIGERVGDVVAA